MITDYDRSGWFGASDTKFIVNDNHKTQTWKDFWLEKTGAITKDVGNAYTSIGTALEHPILEALDGNINLDRQIILEDKRIRVNYDGDLNGKIFEVKTHKGDREFLTKNAAYQFLPKHIYGQVQVQMYAWKEAHKRGEVPKLDKLYVVEYPLVRSDFDGNPSIDIQRVRLHPIKYDKGFIKMYLKKLEPLTKALLEEMKNEETT